MQIPVQNVTHFTSTCVYHFTSTMTHDSTKAITLNCLSFSHPCQILPLLNVNSVIIIELTCILQILRQNVIFNYILQSAFYLSENIIDSSAITHRTITLVDWLPPESLYFYFMHPRNPYRYQVVIKVNSDGNIKLLVSQIHNCDPTQILWDPLLSFDSSIEEEFLIHLNIPLLMEKIMIELDRF